MRKLLTSFKTIFTIITLIHGAIFLSLHSFLSKQKKVDLAYKKNFSVKISQPNSKTKRGVKKPRISKKLLPKKVGIFTKAVSILPPPQYPKSSREKGEQGSISIMVQIGADGLVSSTEIIKSTGYKNLDQSVTKHINNHKFKPAKQGDVPIKSELIIQYNFQLE